MNAMTARTMDPTHSTGRSDASSTTTISVRFASLSPVRIPIKHSMNQARINPGFSPVTSQPYLPPTSYSPSDTEWDEKIAIGQQDRLSSRKNKIVRKEYPGDRELRPMEFHFEAPFAHSVQLAADFTEWGRYPLDMIKAEDGTWFTLVPLAPGNYSYRFLVDGEWCDDPHSFLHVPNPFGTVNAVLEVA